MTRFLPVAVLCLLLSGCGETRRRSPPPVTQVYHTSLSTTPLFLFKEIQDCRDKREWESSEFGLYLFLSGERKIQIRNFEGLLRENLVRNEDLEVVSASLYGEAIEYLFDNRDFRIKQEAASKDVDLCPGTYEYGINTVEGAALNATFFINKTHEKFTAATDLIIPPVTLKIAPKIAQTYITGKNKQTLYLTDNAYYQPDNSTVTFLPHSLEAKLAGLHINFWEIPMVPSHEYGHHIFHTLFAYTSANNMNRIDLCFDNRTKSGLSAIKGSERIIAIEDVLHAFNEGFADLIAYYTLDSSEMDLRGIKCMQGSRDVGSSNFFDGTPKIFTRTALNIFFSEQTRQESKSCEQVDYQDIHAIGAIFAHNADRFLSSMTDSSELKLQVLQEWVSSIRIQHPKNSSLTPEQYFEDVFQIFLRLSLKKFDRKFDRSSCDEVNKFYPGLMRRLVECS